MKTRICKIFFVVLFLASATPWMTPPLALLAGIVFAMMCSPVFTTFAKRTQKYLLQACVVGLGFGMNVESAFRSGRDGMVMTVVSVGTVMILGWVLGRIFKVGRRTSYLISSGTAICGGSAIAAVGPLVGAEDEQMSVSLGTIFVLNAIALFVFPPVGHALGLDEVQFGEWAAIAIHDTSSVVGAGAAYGEKALEVAALVKCTRAMWIFPLALVTMAIWHKRGAKVAMPWFILLFALAMVVNTYLPFPPSLSKSIVWLANRGFAVTLFLIGTGLSRKTLSSCGILPLLLGVSLWIVVSAIGLLAVFFV